MEWKAERIGAEEGLQVWRVEKLELKEVDETEFGNFFSGDCYVLLKTLGSPVPRSWNVHFWIGESSSVDEQFCAAYRSVEIDDFLGGRATQFRESQNFESKQFLALFPGRTIRYLSGGVESTLRNTSESSSRSKRLFKVKGKKNCRIIEVPLEIASLNQGDVFLLDAGDGTIFVWNGPSCNKNERVKGAEVARAMRDLENAGRGRIEIIDSEWDSHKEFFGHLGSRPLPPCSSLDDDEDFEKSAVAHTKLFRVSDSSGTLLVTEIEAPLGPHSLDSDDCFFLDVASSGIYVWMGRGCTPNERREVWTMVNNYLQERRLPSTTSVCKINEGQETAIFRAALNWPADIPLFASESENVKDREEEWKIDAQSLHERKSIKSNVQFDVSGTKKIWRVNDFALEEVPEREHGSFYSGDSYVVLHKPERTRIPTVFFWLGRSSSVDERASAAIFAMQVDEKEANGCAVQKRIIETKEPPQFLALFDNCFVTFRGGHLSGFKRRSPVSSDFPCEEPQSKRRLFQIKEMRVGEISFGANRLNSNDVFVAVGEGRGFVWIGKGANELEIETLEKFKNRIEFGVALEKVFEEAEPAAFWDFLGGRQPYASTRSLANPLNSFSPRLFHASNARGYFRVEEIVEFSQEDLESDDAMILDTNDEIFVWIGNGSNDVEKKLALQLAVEYVSTDPSGRSADDTSMWVVKENAEPKEFCAHFPAWTHGSTEIPEGNVSVEEVLKCYSKCYPLEALMVSVEELPFGVDLMKKEEHLEDAEFESVFGTTKEEFRKMKKWKQIEEKKRVGLF